MKYLDEKVANLVEDGSAIELFLRDGSYSEITRGPEGQEVPGSREKVRTRIEKGLRDVVDRHFASNENQE